MSSGYKVRLIVAADGERKPFVVNEQTGMPHSQATLFAALELRQQAGSHSIIDQTLRGVAELLTFLEQRGIDLLARIVSLGYLTLAELDDLLRFLSLGPASRRQPSDQQASRRVRKPNHGSVRIKVSAIVRYLSWLVDYVGDRRWHVSERPDATKRAEKFLRALSTRKPRIRSARRVRKGLTATQQSALFAALHEMADVAEASGKEDAMFVAERALLWFDWQIEFGHRIGEVLGIRIKDLDLIGGAVDLVRRPNASDDPRPELARLKGDGRNLPLSPYFTKRVRRHIRRWRSGRPLAARHDFLFVSLSGLPLSRSAVNKMFQDLREAHPVLGTRFDSHTMRHTWNEAFGKDGQAGGLTPSEASEARQHIQGWRDPRSARPYLKGELDMRVRAISLFNQQRQMRAGERRRD